MESFSLDSLKEGLSFTDDLLIDSSFILLPKTVSIEDSLLKLLSEWNINTVLCNGNLSLGETEEIQTTEEYIDSEQPEEKPKEKISTNVKKIIEDTRNTRTDNTDQARIDMVLKVYTEYVNCIEQVFTHYVTHKELDKDVVALVNIGKEKSVLSVFNKGILVKELIASLGGEDIDEILL